MFTESAILASHTASLWNSCFDIISLNKSVLAILSRIINIWLFFQGFTIKCNNNFKSWWLQGITSYRIVSISFQQLLLHPIHQSWISHNTQTKICTNVVFNIFIVTTWYGISSERIQYLNWLPQWYIFRSRLHVGNVPDKKFPNFSSLLSPQTERLTHAWHFLWLYRYGTGYPHSSTVLKLSHMLCNNC